MIAHQNRINNVVVQAAAEAAARAGTSESWVTPARGGSRRGGFEPGAGLNTPSAASLLGADEDDARVHAVEGIISMWRDTVAAREVRNVFYFSGKAHVSRRYKT